MSTAMEEEAQAQAQAKKKFTLKSSDGESFEVEEAVAVESQTIKHMIVDDCADDINEIPLPNVTGKILAKVIEYCKKHAEKAQATKGGGGGGEGNGGGSDEEELKNWDAAFLKIDQATLLGLVRAANYLGIKSLSDLTCQNLVDRMINQKIPDFNIKNDFTPEEVEEIRRKNLIWPFE